MVFHFSTKFRYETDNLTFYYYNINKNIQLNLFYFNESFEFSCLCTRKTKTFSIIIHNNIRADTQSPTLLVSHRLHVLVGISTYYVFILLGISKKILRNKNNCNFILRKQERIMTIYPIFTYNKCTNGCYRHWNVMACVPVWNTVGRHMVKHFVGSDVLTWRAILSFPFCHFNNTCTTMCGVTSTDDCQRILRRDRDRRRQMKKATDQRCTNMSVCLH